MDALNSIPMYVFIYFTALFFVLKVVVEPFTEYEVNKKSVSRIIALVELMVIMSGITSFSLLNSYSYTKSITAGVFAGVLFIIMRRKASNQTGPE